MVYPLLAALALVKITALGAFGMYKLGENKGDIEKAIEAIAGDLKKLGSGAHSILIELPQSLYALSMSDDLASIVHSIKHTDSLIAKLPSEVQSDVQRAIEPIIIGATKRAAYAFIMSGVQPGETHRATISRKYLGLYLFGHCGMQLSFEEMAEVKHQLEQLHLECNEAKVAKTLRKFKTADIASTFAFGEALAATSVINALRVRGNDMMMHIFIIYALRSPIDQLDFSGIKGVLLDRFGSESKDSKVA